VRVTCVTCASDLCDLCEWPVWPVRVTCVSVVWRPARTWPVTAVWMTCGVGCVSYMPWCALQWRLSALMVALRRIGSIKALIEYIIVYLIWSDNSIYGLNLGIFYDIQDIKFFWLFVLSERFCILEIWTFFSSQLLRAYLFTDNGKRDVYDIRTCHCRRYPFV